MNNILPSEDRPCITHISREYITYPPRTSLRIDRIHWERLVRSIGQIPKSESVYRDLAFVCLGISIPTLVSAVTLVQMALSLPTWISILYWCIGAVTLVAFILCLLFDKKMTSVSSRHVTDVLQEMEEIKSHSGISEEISGALQTPTPSDD